MQSSYRRIVLMSLCTTGLAAGALLAEDLEPAWCMDGVGTFGQNCQGMDYSEMLSICETVVANSCNGYNARDADCVYQFGGGWLLRCEWGL